jgi:hypothetical protein
VSEWKVSVSGRLVKLLLHTRTDRGMTLAGYATRCLLRGEIHEIVTTDQTDAAAGERIDRVGFVGFAELERGGVVERGDVVLVEGVALGRVLGFDDCHFPNHLNVLVASDRLLTARDLGAGVGAEIRFEPRPEGPSPE